MFFYELARRLRWEDGHIIIHDGLSARDFCFSEIRYLIVSTSENKELETFERATAVQEHAKVMENWGFYVWDDGFLWNLVQLDPYCMSAASGDVSSGNSSELHVRN